MTTPEHTRNLRAWMVHDDNGVSYDAWPETKAGAIADSVRLFWEVDIRLGIIDPDEIREELRGKDLCCYCPPEQLCHADVLLEIANG